MGAETGLMSFEDGEYRQPLEADEAGVCPPEPPEGDGPTSTVTLGQEARFILPTSSQKVISSCYFKPLTLWQLVTTAIWSSCQFL